MNLPISLLSATGSSKQPKISIFRLMEPSPLELLSTLEAKSGQAISNEIYAFKDKGDREVALRFDLTIGLTRHIALREET